MASQPVRDGVDVSAWKPSNHVEPLPIIWSLLGRHIAFHRRLVDLTGSVKSALLLSQSIYWTRHGRDIAQSGGWFHKTTQQWTWETGLSAKEQRLAREALHRLCIVQERRMGVPGRACFRLDLERLSRSLSDRIDFDPCGINWHDRVVVAELLGPTVAYHRALATIGGGAHAGLMLSRALYLTRMQVTRQRDVWISTKAARWSEELGLTRREQESARRDLMRAGIWQEALQGMPSGLVARVQLDCLLALLTAGTPAASRDAGHTVAPVCVDAADRFVQKGESSLRQLHILHLPFPPSHIRPFRHPSIYTKSTSDLVQPQHAATQVATHSASEANAPGSVDGRVDDAGGGGVLIFPDQMLAPECAAARMLLRPCAEQAQALLDELAGRLQANGVRGSPVAYLRGLIARAQAGTFIPEIGIAVAAERRNLQLAAEQRIARELEEGRQEAQRVTPEYQARVRAQRQKLSQLRDDMKQRIAATKPP